MTTPATIANAVASNANPARNGHGSAERTVTRGTPADMLRVHRPNRIECLSPHPQPLSSKRERGRKPLHLGPLSSATSGRGEENFRPCTQPSPASGEGEEKNCYGSSAI